MVQFFLRGDNASHEKIKGLLLEARTEMYRRELALRRLWSVHYHKRMTAGERNGHGNAGKNKSQVDYSGDRLRADASTKYKYSKSG